MKPANQAHVSNVESPLCIVGETVREVIVLSEAEWEVLPEAARPSPAEYFPGLGWVCAARRAKEGRERVGHVSGTVKSD